MRRGEGLILKGEIFTAYNFRLFNLSNGTYGKKDKYQPVWKLNYESILKAIDIDAGFI